MGTSCNKTFKGSKIARLEDKCLKIHAKIVRLQALMKKIEKKSADNFAWRGLLNSAVTGMNEALCDLDRRLKHIEMELKEVSGAVVFILCFSLFAAGCGHLRESAKCVWGSSIAHLEEARSSGRSVEIALSLDDAFKRTEGILSDKDALVYLKDRGQRYLAAMHFKGHVDTTQVGVFFEKTQDGRTKVEVASMSPRLVEEVSGFLFSGLGGDEGLKKGEGA